MTRTVKRPEERRADIIQAARYLFQTQEYSKTTMQDVMTELGIAKGTIYHYFPSKEALLEAVVEEMVDTNIEQLANLIEKSKGNALEKLQHVIQLSNIASKNEEILSHLHRSGNEAMHTRLLAETILKQAPLYEKLIRQGCDEGVFKTEAPLECAEFMLTGIQFLTDRGIYGWSAKDLTRRVHAFPRLIEQQLKAPSGSFQFIVHQFKEVEQ
jgi:AcrR family transcriptional regulator